jgi:O-antigen/teichoic acid export membrane protein
MLTFTRRPPTPGRPARASRLRSHLHRALPGIRLTAVSGTLGARIGTTGLGALAAIAAARGLGTHGRALLALMMAVPTLCTVVGVLGMDNANARFAGRSHSAFRQVVRRSVVFAGVAGSAFGAGWWFSGLIWPAMRFGIDSRLALLSAAVCPVCLLVTLLSTAEIGRDQIAAYNLILTATTTVYVAGVVVLFATGKLTVARCFLVFAVSQLLALVAFLKLAAGRVHPDGEQVSHREYRSYAFRVYLPNLVQYGMLRMDIPLIQILAGTTAVAMYAVALPAAEILMLIPTAAALVIFPRVTSGAVDMAAARRIGRTVLAASTAFAAVIALGAPVLIPVVYGAQYRNSVAVVWCMLPGMVLFSAVRVRQAYLAATDQLKQAIMATTAAAAACLACLIALAPRFGAAGAGVADSAGYLAFALVLVGATRRRSRLHGWPFSC